MRALLIAVLVGLVAAPAAGAATVRSGTLAAEIAEQPWRLSFSGPGGVRLAELVGTGTGVSGALGFRASGQWWRATRVEKTEALGSGDLRLEVATTDPGGRRLEVRLSPGAEESIGVDAVVLGERGDVDAYGIAFEASEDERYLGFGERPATVDHRGRTVESYVADGPYNPEERPFLQAFVPVPGYRFRDDATYFPMPWLLSTRGYGVLVESDETVYHRLGSDRGDAWSVEVVGAPEGMTAPHLPQRLRFRVFGGPRPADVLRRMSAHLGRQPAPAAPWVFGAWYQPGGTQDEQIAQVEQLRRADAPVSVAQTYLHYLPCGDHRADRDGERRRIARLKAAGVAVTTYFNPMVCSNYSEAYDPAVAADALTRNASGEPYLYRYSTDDQFLVGQFDFTSAGGRQIFAKLLGDAIADGHDGWMEDFGEYTPLDAISADDTPGTQMHNRYPVDYHCAAYDAVKSLPRPIVRFQRSGWTGVAKCAQVVWNGDPTTDWGFDGLASAVRGALSMGLSGVSTWGSDIGGFFALGQRKLSPELLTRWVQFGAVSPVMRTQRNGIALPPKARPQVDDADQIANWRRYAKLHTQLYPYLTAADAEYRRSGLPVMRHLSLAFPDDPRATARDDEFLFGDSLLAAPVLSPGAKERRLYVPEGDWIDLWRAARYDKGTGGLQLTGAAAEVRGGRDVTVPAPLEELPLLVRAGHVLPLLPADVDTLAPGGAPGTVGLGDRPRRLDLLAFPRGRWSTRLAGGERIHSHVGRLSWRLRFVGDATHRLTVQARLPRKPCRVTVGGKRVRGWTYRDGVLRASWKARRASLIAHRRCSR